MPLPTMKRTVEPEPAPKGRLQRWVEAVEARVVVWPWRTMGMAVAVVAAAGGLGVGYMYRIPLADWTAVQVAKATGATVQSVVVSGAVYTGKDDFAAALGLNKGDSLVGFDARSARARIENLPWVRLATVERQLPATVKVVVYEHVPLARVADEGQIWVVGKDGGKIVVDGSNAFAALPLLQGAGAPQAAGGLFAVLATWPQLMGQLREAHFVGERRWDLKFASGVMVMLPEEQVPEALAMLAKLEEARHVLTLNAGEVDLRLPDRVVLRLPESVGATPVTDKDGLKG